MINSIKFLAKTKAKKIKYLSKKNLIKENSAKKRISEVNAEKCLKEKFKNLTILKY